MSEVPNPCEHLSYEQVSGASKFHTRNWCVKCGAEMSTQQEENEDGE
jgi:hypothetical protein